MTAARRPSDPIADVIGLLRPRTVLTSGLCATGPWAVRFEPFPHVQLGGIARGECWLVLEGRKKTIVVMDDSEIILETLRALFEAAGYSVSTACNLEELERVRANAKPDLFILDVQMPEAFGDDVARVLKEVRRVRTPILLFSSLEETALRERAEEAEVDGYVSKNSGVGPLLARVASLLGGGEEARS
jgi:CheY-like chemotaxis protein